MLLVLMTVVGCATIPARVSKSAPLPVRDGPAWTPKTRDQAATMSVMLSGKKGFSACVQEEKQHSDATGKIILVFDILPSGEVAEVGVRWAETASLELTRCLAAVVAGLRFPPSSEVETIGFPFKF